MSKRGEPMSSVIKINACAYSRIGHGRKANTNSFYMNGKFSSEEQIDNIQASMENRGLEYLFAVSDNMICDYPEQEMNVSIVKELGKIHEKITVTGGDIRSKALELENKVNETEQVIKDFYEINGDSSVIDQDFSGLLLSSGKLVAISSGEGRVFMLRDGAFRQLAIPTETSNDDTEDEEDDQDITILGKESRGNAVVSDIYDIEEGDSFILVSKGLFDALGEDKIEDLVALRSDSTYIAYRLVDEAIKRRSEGDVTALVVQVEKVANSPRGSRKQPAKTQNKQTVKSRVDRLSRAPAVTYKYHKRNTDRLKSMIYSGMVIIIVIIMFGILYLSLKSLMETGRSAQTSPSPSVSASNSPGQTLIPYETEPGYAEPTPDPTPTATPTVTPEQTPEAEIRTHVVKSGDSMSAIVRTYYGDESLMDALCKYNGISNPNMITLGQKIKIPPKEDLK